MTKINGAYHFKHYTISKYTNELEEGKPPFIETDVVLEDREGSLTGTIRSEFGTGEIESVSKWEEECVSFGGDMGGGRRVWWSLALKENKLVGTVMPWEQYGAVKWPLSAEGRKVEGRPGELAGVYYFKYYNACVDTGKKTEEVVSTAYLFLEEENGVLTGRLDYPIGTGRAYEFEQKDGWLYFRTDYAENQNTWYRLHITDDGLLGDVTPYPFHFAWPFVVVGEKSGE